MKKRTAIIISSVCVVVITIIVVITAQKAGIIKPFISTTSETTSATTGDPNTTYADFTYTLKDSYSSRLEIIREKDNLDKSFNEYSNGKSDEAVRKEREVVRSLQNKLTQELEKYPKGENEILLEKENALRSEIHLLGFDFYGDPNFEINQENERAVKKMVEFKKGLEIQKQYENGTITIDEALNTLGIKYKVENATSGLCEERVSAVAKDEKTS